MLIKDAKKITYSLTRTSKMPGKSYSLPAWACQTGSKLRKIEGTPCFSCYALKGNYIRYPNIKDWKVLIIHYGLTQWQHKLMMMFLGGMTQEIYKVLNT